MRRLSKFSPLCQKRKLGGGGGGQITAESAVEIGRVEN